MSSAGINSSLAGFSGGAGSNNSTSTSSGTTRRDSLSASTPGTPDTTEGLVATSSLTTTVRNRKGQVVHGNGSLAGANGTLSEAVTTSIDFVGARGVAPSVDRDGGIHLRPLPASARKDRKIRALVNFQPRQSRFDRFNMESSKDGFRGFYTLFWIGMGLTILNTFYASYKSTGHVLSLTFATLFSRDAKILALSDAVLVGSLFLCVPFAQIAKNGLLPYSKCLVFFQHFWQAAMLGAVVKWTHFREWPWVQSGFFVLHTLSMMMKIHSYMSVNGNMADTFWRMRRKEQQLRERVLEVAGVRPTGDHQKDEKMMKDAWKVACGAALGSAEELVESAWSSLEAQERTSPIRYRSRSSSVTKAKRLSLTGAPDGLAAFSSNAVPIVQSESRLSESTTQEKANGASPPSEAKDSKKKVEVQMLIRDPHPLATHPDAVISGLASQIELMREELLSNGPHDGLHAAEGPRVAWPHNISYANFWDYLLIPSLVYELEFPRTKSVRPLYILEKVGATLGTFFVIYVITEHWIMPFQPGPGQSLVETFLQLAVPMMINYLLIFYIMFECICNAFAEFTRFADREFYSDWWNATSMDVFSRKWNKPVHNFLLRHVYASSISVGASKSAAMFVTFLLSSLLHELVMAIVSGKIRGYLFMMQMAQMPLILLGQVPFIKNNEGLGNLIFWIGLLMGFPMLNILYISY